MKVFISLVWLTLNFSLHAKNLGLGSTEVSLTALQKKISETSLKVNNTYDGTLETFVGFSLTEILDKLGDAKWRSRDGLVFTALDGYKMDIPVAKITQYQPQLSYRYQDPDRPFKVDKKTQGGIVDLAPFYLVWPNLKYPELIAQGNDDWPYQVAKIEVVNYPQYYAKLFPFLSSDLKVKSGFEGFKRNCMACHALAGQGGTKGPDLWPWAGLKKIPRDKFVTFVLNPQKTKPDTTMPSMAPEQKLAERKRVAGLIYGYLNQLNLKEPARQK